MVRALQEARLGFGPQDGHAAAAHNNLAEVYRKMGQADRAESLYLEVSPLYFTKAGSRSFVPLSLSLYHITFFHLVFPLFFENIS